jgi:hypothetical protein
MMFRYQSTTQQDVWINAKQVTHIVRQNEKTSSVFFAGGTFVWIAHPAHELAAEVEAHSKYNASEEGE